MLKMVSWQGLKKSIKYAFANTHGSRKNSYVANIMGMSCLAKPKPTMTLKEP